jgi:hypothetical protein
MFELKKRIRRSKSSLKQNFIHAMRQYQTTFQSHSLLTHISFIWISVISIDKSYNIFSDQKTLKKYYCYYSFEDKMYDCRKYNVIGVFVIYYIICWSTTNMINFIKVTLCSYFHSQVKLNWLSKDWLSKSCLTSSSYWKMFRIKL